MLFIIKLGPRILFWFDIRSILASNVVKHTRQLKKERQRALPGKGIVKVSKRVDAAVGSELKI